MVCELHRGLFKSLILLVSIFLSACTGMQPAQKPELMLEAAHLFGVSRVIFDDRGGRVLSGGFKGDVALWSVPEGKLIKRLKVHQDYVVGLAWLNNVVAVTASEGGELAVTDFSKERVVWRKQYGSGISAIAYQVGRSRIIVGFDSGRISSYSYPGLQQVKSVDMGAGVVALATDRQGRRLAISLEDDRVVLLDADLQMTQQLQVPEKNSLELRFSPNGEELAAGAWYNVYYWDLKTGQLRVQETEHWGAVTSVDYTPDSKQLITLGRHTDANLRLVDIETGIVQRRLQGHRLCGASVRVSPNGRFVVSGSDDETIRLYDIEKIYHPTKPLKSW